MECTTPVPEKLSVESFHTEAFAALEVIESVTPSTATTVVRSVNELARVTTSLPPSVYMNKPAEVAASAYVCPFAVIVSVVPDSAT